MNRDQERLFAILECVERIAKYVARGREGFDADELIQYWIVHHLQIIGEAAKNISEAFKQIHSQIPWEKMTRLRNIIVHDYFGLDLEILWRLAQNEVPQLGNQIENLLHEFPSD